LKFVHSLEDEELCLAEGLHGQELVIEVSLILKNQMSIKNYNLLNNSHRWGRIVLSRPWRKGKVGNEIGKIVER
jgi:hypothetical protein